MKKIFFITLLSLLSQKTEAMSFDEIRNASLYLAATIFIGANIKYKYDTNFNRGDSEFVMQLDKAYKNYIDANPNISSDEKLHCPSKDHQCYHNFFKLRSLEEKVAKYFKWSTCGVEYDFFGFEHNGLIKAKQTYKTACFFSTLFLGMPCMYKLKK